MVWTLEVLEEGRMNQPDNVTRLKEINARLEELSQFDILDFWEEVKKLEQEKASLERNAAA
jgi:hypothetical protein